MIQEIVIFETGARQIVGDTAHRLAARPDWDSIAAQVSPGRFCIFDDKGILRASQSTVRGAWSYMADEDRVLIYHNNPT